MASLKLQQVFMFVTENPMSANEEPVQVYKTLAAPRILLYYLLLNAMSILKGL